MSLSALCCWTLLSSLIQSVRADIHALKMAGGLYTELPDGLDEVDVIIAGGKWMDQASASASCCM